MDLHLQGDVAVVTGGASGIGCATAELFAEQGATVALLDIDPSVEQIASGIADRFGVAASGLVCDVATESDLQQAASHVLRTAGRCDHLVCAAGAGSGKYGFPFWNLQPADWGPVIQINLLGVIHAVHAFTPAMIDAKRGTILMLSSVAAQIGSQTDPPYSAAKAAVLNFAQCAAKDLAPYGIRVNTLCPGMVKTPLNQSVWESWNRQQPEEERLSYEEWAEAKIAAVTPLGRWQQPADVAAMAVFLASDRAANITGQTVNVDGGQVMHW